MAHSDASVTDEGSSSLTTFEVDLDEVAQDLKMLDWDSSSLYQVNKFVNYYDNEKCMTFDYLCL